MCLLCKTHTLKVKKFLNNMVRRDCLLYFIMAFGLLLIEKVAEPFEVLLVTSKSTRGHLARLLSADPPIFEELTHVFPINHID